MGTKASKRMLSGTITEYLEYKRARGDAESTLSSYKVVLLQFLRFTGDKQLTNVTDKHCEDWFYGPGGLSYDRVTSQRTPIVVPPLKPSSHNQYRGAMNAFFVWCIRNNYLRSNPMVRVETRKVPKRPRQRPSPKILLDVLEATDSPRDRCYIAVALNSALRASEITPIRVGQVDLDEGFIYDVIIRKTGDMDDIAITADLDRELRRWVVKYQEEIGRPLKKDDHLFPSRVRPVFGPWITEPDGTRVQTIRPTRYVPESPILKPQHIVKKALAACGLETRYEGTHTLRRAVARAYYDMLVAQGEPDVAALRMTQAMLHHALVSTTERYLGLDLERVQKNRSLRGKPFLSHLVDSAEGKVVPIRRSTLGE